MRARRFGAAQRAVALGGLAASMFGWLLWACDGREPTADGGDGDPDGDGFADADGDRDSDRDADRDADRDGADHDDGVEVDGAPDGDVEADTEQEPPGVFPGTEWEVRSPESQGIDGAALQGAMDYLGSLYAEGGTDGVVVIRNGYEVWSGDGVDTRQNLYSAGKFLVATLVGVMVDEGYFTLGTPVHEWEPTLEGHDEYRRITLTHLLTMTSGYDAVNSPPHVNKFGAADDDWSATPSSPAEPRFEPGTAYLYWDDAVNITNLALTRRLGRTLDGYFREKIATPIGAADFVWKTFEDSELSPTEVGGVEINGIFIDMTARDLARFGHLFLHRGRWDGAQIVSRSFVEEATTSQVPRSTPLYSDINPDPAFLTADHGELAGSGVFGYHLWVNGTQADGETHLPDAPLRTFYANGGWSVVFVVPEWNMVLVRVGRRQPTGGIQEAWNEILRRVGEAL